MTRNNNISQHRTPPHSLEAERAVLGGMLLDNKAAPIALTHLDAEGKDFYSEANRTIFKTALSLIEKGFCDSLLLINALRDRGTLDKVGGASYLASLYDDAISSANIEHYARIIREKSLARALIGAAQSILELAYSPNGTGAAELLEEAQRSVFEIAASGKKSDIRKAREVASKAFSIIEKRYQQGDELIGISTGLKDLDDITLGLQDSELVIVAGRPGMGKTALAVNIAEHAALEDVPTAIFSLEMSAESLMLRIFAGMSGIDARQIRRGLIGEAEWPRLVQVAGLIGMAPLFIDDSPGLTPLELKARARRLKHEHGIGLLILDYLQLMRGTSKRESREQEIAEISRSLKALARELEIPVIACSQLNRQVENRSDRRPGLADLRESGAIEQDADVIMFLYRDEIYNKSENNPEKGVAEIIIGKQRNGPSGYRTRVQFQTEIQKFRDLARQESKEDRRYR